MAFVINEDKLVFSNGGIISSDLESHVCFCLPMATTWQIYHRIFVLCLPWPFHLSNEICTLSTLLISLHLTLFLQVEVWQTVGIQHTITWGSDVKKAQSKPQEHTVCGTVTRLWIYRHNMLIYVTWLSPTTTLSHTETHTYTYTKRQTGATTTILS